MDCVNGFGGSSSEISSGKSNEEIKTCNNIIVVASSAFWLALVGKFKIFMHMHESGSRLPPAFQ